MEHVNHPDRIQCSAEHPTKVLVGPHGPMPVKCTLYRNHEDIGSKFHKHVSTGRMVEWGWED